MGRDVRVSTTVLDVLGLLAIATAASSLGAAVLVENPMGMGVLMGVFLANLFGGVVLFLLSRWPRRATEPELIVDDPRHG